MSDADDEMSAADESSWKRWQARSRQRPVDLAARCEGLLAWIDVDAELAKLLDQPVTEATGTRGATSSAMLVFVVDDGSCVIELDASPNGLRGQLLGGDAREVVVRTASGASHPTPVDDSGGFSLDDPAPGTIRLELELISESRRIHTDWFVV